MRARPPELFGIPINQIARACGVSVKTASRWKDGQTVPPAAAMMILARDLGCFDPAWSGWTIRGAMLISPESWEITLHDVLATPLLRQQLATYQAELRNMKDAVAGLEEQPAPGDWDVQILA